MFLKIAATLVVVSSVVAVDGSARVLQGITTACINANSAFLSCRAAQYPFGYANDCADYCPGLNCYCIDQLINCPTSSCSTAALQVKAECCNQPNPTPAPDIPCPQEYRALADCNAANGGLTLTCADCYQNDYYNPFMSGTLETCEEMDAVASNIVNNCGCRCSDELEAFFACEIPIVCTKAVAPPPTEAVTPPPTEAVTLPPTGAGVVAPIYLRNACNKDIRVAVVYLDPKTSSWTTMCWWNIIGGQGYYLGDAGGKRIVTNNAIIGFYAETMDGSLVWEGNDLIATCDNRNLKIRESNGYVDDDGDIYVRFTCPLRRGLERVLSTSSNSWEVFPNQDESYAHKHSKSQGFDETTLALAELNFKHENSNVLNPICSTGEDNAPCSGSTTVDMITDVVEDAPAGSGASGSWLAPGWFFGLTAILFSSL